MSAPWPPSEILKKIPSVSAAFCGRFVDFLALPKVFFDLYAYERDESGDITSEFCADIQSCVAGTGTTGGGGGGTSGTLETPVLSATDGTYTDKIVVNWNAVVPLVAPTRYELWRGSSSDVATATKLTDVNATTTFADLTAQPGTIYWYFVRAFDGASPANSSAYSQGDSGYAGALVGSLGAVSDLTASKGFYRAGFAAVHLVWTKVASAQSYDVYRNTVDDYTTATLLEQNRTPATPVDNANGRFYGSSPLMVDNGTEIAYQDTVGHSLNDINATKSYYYWVVAKRVNPSAYGDFSTAAGAAAGSHAGALGWGQGQGNSAPSIFGYTYATSGAAAVGPSGTAAGVANRAWVIFYGSSAGGAGGDLVRGGGGGGISGTVVGLMTISLTAKFRVVSAPEADPGASATATNGTDGPVSKVQYSALGDFSDTIDLIVCAAPGGGVWNGAGGGAGGAGATASSVHASLNPTYTYAGRSGFAASGGAGGDSGYQFGFFRGSPRREIILNPAFGNAEQQHAGGGSIAEAQGAVLALGGKGSRGFLALVWYLA